MNKLIPNSNLTIENLPDPVNRNAVFAFAMTFNGYEHFGSFEGAAENARARRRATLTDLRNELFMAARGSQHRGDDKFLEDYRELLPLLKQKILQEQSR